MRMPAAWVVDEYHVYCTSPKASMIGQIMSQFSRIRYALRPDGECGDIPRPDALHCDTLRPEDISLDTLRP